MIDPIKKQLADNLLRELADRGQILEGGFRAYELLTGLSEASAIQRSECRKAYFLGAQHLYSSCLQMLDPGDEPTEQDIERMAKIDAELRAFIESLNKK